MNKNILWIVAVVAVGLVAFYGGQNVGNSITGNVVKESGSLTAPDFSVKTIDGKVISLKDNKANNKPTVLYFMSSTCSTCAKNWAALNQAYPNHKNKVDLVAVSVDPTDTVDVLKNLRTNKNIVFDMSAGNPNLALSYKVKKQTAKFAIDAKGNILERHDGALSVAEWNKFFQQL